MDESSYFLPAADISNSSYLPGFVMPAAVLLLALLSAAVVLYFTRVRGGSSDRDDV